MSLKSYMLSQKYRIFPEFLKIDEEKYISETRFKKVNDISYRDWFWLHPSCYKLLYFGVSWLTIIIFGITCIVSIYNTWIFPAVLTGIVCMHGCYDLYKKSRTRLSHYMTFYELWMR